MRVVMNPQETFLLQLSRFVQAALMIIFGRQNHFVFSQARNENITRMESNSHGFFQVKHKVSPKTDENR